MRIMIQLMMRITIIMMRIRRGFRELRELVGSRFRWREVDGFRVRKRQLGDSSFGMEGVQRLQAVIEGVHWLQPLEHDAVVPGNQTRQQDSEN